MESPDRTIQPEYCAPVFRSLKKDDLPALEWNGEYTHFRRVYADVYRRMTSGKLAAWVVDLPNTGIAGQVFVQYTCDHPELADGFTRAYLYSIRVKPQFRNMGLGSQLIRFAEEDLISKGYLYATLNVAKDNLRAQRLYVRLGYKVIAHEPGIWSYPDEKGIWHRVVQPAWRMIKPLTLTDESSLSQS